MFDFKISLSSFRLCRRKTKSPANFFSPVNPKTFEITYPIIPSPPPTTPEFHKTMKPKDDENNLSSFSDDQSGWFTNNTDDVEPESVESLDGSGGVNYGKVMKESMTVVRWSEHPYDDFKKSMLEMVLEKQMFEAKDLEQLLQCFLSLNHRNHHADIVAAFTEIWELLFR
ncbi:hypothetical protein SSX86_000058 [Deinandra increscens subsp. villosa]|uniref:Transcription repressor n=1 Tax=Deinandra increscens subsp. villosa TaxID=3103831 RepID=A0AAP0DVV6_9ASTR